MQIILILVHVAVCVALILIVLLQRGKGAGMGAAFGGTSQTVFGPPLYPFKIGVALGAILMVIQGLAKFIRDWLQAITGKETTI